MANNKFSYKEVEPINKEGERFGEFFYLIYLSDSYELNKDTFNSISETRKQLESISTPENIFVSLEALKTLV